VGGETRLLATWLSTLTYEQVPTRCRDVLKLALLDDLGCALAGAAAPWTRQVTEWVLAQGGRKDASIWASPARVPASTASLANGVAVHAWCFDDTHPPTKTHPGAVVIPAVAAVAERMGAEGRAVSGRAFLTALAAGYETMIRVALAAGPSKARLRGWQITGIAGPFGSAAAAAHLLGLDAAGTASALGLAGTQASGLYAFTADGTDSERFHAGRAAQAGVMGAELAGLGLKGPTQVLEAEDGGFCRTISDGGDAARAVEGLGERFFSHELLFKPYPVCASLASAVDAIQALKRNTGLAVDQVETIEVGISHVVMVQCGRAYEPLGVLQAQMSLQYCVAAALLSQSLSVADFQDSRLAAADTLALARCVRGVIDSDVDRVYPGRMSSVVTLTMLKDGRQLRTRVDDPKGSERNPMSVEEIMLKFHSQADSVLGRQAAEAVVEAVVNLEALPDVRPVLAHLSVAHAYR